MNDIDIDEMLLDLGSKAIASLKRIYESFLSKINSVTLNSGELTTAPLLEEAKSLLQTYLSPLDELSSKTDNVKTLIEDFFLDVARFFQLYEEEPKETDEKEKVMSLYDQTDYNDRYSTGTIASSGCGITCLAMIASYFTGEEWTPDECATLGNKVEGHQIDNVGRFLTAADKIGLNYEEATHKDLLPALEKGKVAIVLVNSGGHFVVAKGLTEDGKIMINDPYGPWQDAKDEEGYILTFSEWGYMDKNELGISYGKIWIFDGSTAEKFNFTTEEEQTITV